MILRRIQSETAKIKAVGLVPYAVFLGHDEHRQMAAWLDSQDVVFAKDCPETFPQVCGLYLFHVPVPSLFSIGIREGAE